MSNSSATASIPKHVSSDNESVFLLKMLARLGRCAHPYTLYASIVNFGCQALAEAASLYAKSLCYDLADLLCKKRWDSVAHLRVL